MRRDREGKKTRVVTLCPTGFTAIRDFTCIDTVQYVGDRCEHRATQQRRASGSNSPLVVFTDKPTWCTYA